MSKEPVSATKAQVIKDEKQAEVLPVAHKVDKVVPLGEGSEPDYFNKGTEK